MGPSYHPLMIVVVTAVSTCLACNHNATSDFDGDGYPDDVDCSPDDPAVNPGAVEQCDGIDNDCDGVLLPEEVDDDGDGHDECRDGDCDDADPAVYPGADQVCDGVADNDCDGIDDEGEIDGDADGWTLCDGDCDDGEAAVNPGQPEICDGLDNDCDPVTDETADLDGDGLTRCAGDCDDGDPAISPWAAELCGDAVDSNCDGSVDAECLTCDATLIPGGTPTIQDSVSASPRDTVICLEPGTYTENIDFAGAAVHVVGVAGPNMTAIAAAASGSVVRFATEEPDSAILEGVTVRDGSATNGAGVYIAQADPTLRRVVIESNTASERGGGLYASFSSATLRGVVVRDNEAATSGGGLYVVASEGDESLLTLEDCSVLDNRVTGPVGTAGGGVAIADATVVFDRVIIAGNTGPHFGGGLELAGGHTMMTNVIIAGNEASDQGGGIRVNDADPVLDNVALLGNRAALGGGLSVLTANAPQLQQVLVVGNIGDVGAGGIYASNYSTTLVVGGIVAFNQGGAGSAGVVGDGLLGTDVTFEGCTIHGNQPQDVLGITNPFAVGDNLGDDPRLLDITVADPLLWDLHLAGDSPCIDGAPDGCHDDDGSPCDQGLYGGALGAAWDRDVDGWPEWWQPGAYDASSYPAAGWDCDDRAAGRTPLSGC